MHAYKTASKIDENGELHVSHLPFSAGEQVEVIVYLREPLASVDDRYPLQGTPIRYERPEDPVAVEDWDALQ